MLKMEFLNAITQPTGDKWQSKTLFLAILIHIHPLLGALSIAAYQVWKQNYFYNRNMKNVNNS